MLNKLKYLLRKKIARSVEKNDIDIEELKKMIEKDAILLDVRSPQEYKEGHLEGSYLIPEYELKAKAQEILFDKERPIVVYCSSGNRSKKAQKLLEKMGYKNVYNLHGGLEKMENNGYQGLIISCKSS